MKTNIMTQEQLKESMNLLFNELSKSNNKNSDRTIIAKAVQLGMKYQEEKIKEGINIVFREINK